MVHRGSNAVWDIYGTQKETTWEKVPIAVLMDIREALKGITAELRMMRHMQASVYECHRFLKMPLVLDKIAKNTTKPKRKKKVAKEIA